VTSKPLCCTVALLVAFCLAGAQFAFACTACAGVQQICGYTAAAKADGCCHGTSHHYPGEADPCREEPVCSIGLVHPVISIESGTENLIPLDPNIGMMEKFFSLNSHIRLGDELQSPATIPFEHIYLLTQVLLI
jgi:hypothetical protein